jgi:hypothetical protein
MNLSPFTARVGLSQRSAHLVDLIVRNNPMVTDYRLWVARTLNDSYGTVADSGLTGTGGNMIMESRVNRLVQSLSIERRGWASTAEVRRGQTSFFFDVDDFIVPAPPLPSNVPSDSEYLFARVQEKRLTTGWSAVDALAIKNASMPIRGSILVVPDPSFFSSAASVYSLAGTAPAGSDCVAGSPPVIDQSAQKPMPMHIVFPRPPAVLTIHNNDPAETLLVSFGVGQPMMAILHGETVSPTGGGYSMPGVPEVFLAMLGAGGGCPFALDGVIGLQWQ